MLPNARERRREEVDQAHVHWCRHRRGWRLPACGVAGFTFAPSRHSLVSADAAEKGQLTTWITITPDNLVTILIPHCEMGQGTPTALAMMAAEEREVDGRRSGAAPCAWDVHYCRNGIVRAAGGNYVPAVLGRGVDHAPGKMAEWFGLW